MKVVENVPDGLDKQLRPEEHFEPWAGIGAGRECSSVSLHQHVEQVSDLTFWTALLGQGPVDPSEHKRVL